MDDTEKFNRLQELMFNAYMEYQAKRKKKVSDNEFARYLGVSPVSYNQWLNGSRYPDYSNAIKLSTKLGMEIFDILGYPRVLVGPIDSKILFIA